MYMSEQKLRQHISLKYVFELLSSDDNFCSGKGIFDVNNNNNNLMPGNGKNNAIHINNSYEGS